jgi:hypothetical protein
MEYEINVAKNNVHYFRVMASYGNVKKVYMELKKKFSDCNINVFRMEKIASWIDMDNF